MPPLRHNVNERRDGYQSCTVLGACDVFACGLLAVCNSAITAEEGVPILHETLSQSARTELSLKMWPQNFTVGLRPGLEGELGAEWFALLSTLDFGDFAESPNSSTLLGCGDRDSRLSTACIKPHRCHSSC